ncbi:acetyl esterase [Brevibacterium daeguense]|uniref:Acetyl esterase n=1 Tax=Brevibacterium daeguense TaxID=909936 RepID=A0ABP8EHN7_9MICO|nr:alpha/beta hydrolase fold domain-containing protein [Brevibacterium daeguense]
MAQQTFEDIPAYIRTAFTPQMREVVEHQLARRAGLASQASPPAEPVDPIALAARMREDYRDERSFWNVGGPQPFRTEDLHIRAAGVDVPVRIHRPSDSDSLPAIVYFHGGGFNVGDLDTHDRITRVLADVSGAAVVSVDYSLSPEAKFPQALHECAGVVAQLAVNGHSFGIDPDRLAVAGDSAGAMLSVATALLLRDDPQSVPELPAGAADRAFSSVRAMVLYYGGHGLADSASARLYGGFWDDMGPADLDQPDLSPFSGPEDRRSPYVDHLSADLSAPLPSAYIIGAELDPLADSTRAFGTLLAHHGHDVSWRIVPGVLHSFIHFGRMLDEANEVLAGGAAFVRSRFEAAAPQA